MYIQLCNFRQTNHSWLCCCTMRKGHSSTHLWWRKALLIMTNSWKGKCESKGIKRNSASKHLCIFLVFSSVSVGCASDTVDHQISQKLLRLQNILHWCSFLILCSSTWFYATFCAVACRHFVKIFGQFYVCASMPNFMLSIFIHVQNCFKLAENFC